MADNKNKIGNRIKREVQQGAQGKNVFFKSSETKDEKVEKELDSLLRQTYYVSELQRKAIAFMAAHEDIDKSEIVRKALEEYIPKKYIQMVLFK